MNCLILLQFFRGNLVNCVGFLGGFLWLLKISYVIWLHSFFIISLLGEKKKSAFDLSPGGRGGGGGYEILF